MFILRRRFVGYLLQWKKLDQRWGGLLKRQVSNVKRLEKITMKKKRKRKNRKRKVRMRNRRRARIKV